MAYATDEGVRGIVSVREGDSLVPFLAAAASIVTRHLVPVFPADITEDELTQVETWLAAHFYSIWRQRRASESASVVSASYQYNLGLYLASTMYGQQAMMMDPTGLLAALNAETTEGKRRQRFGVLWMGKEPERTWE
jgi:hypothetical protein